MRRRSFLRSGLADHDSWQRTLNLPRSKYSYGRERERERRIRSRAGPNPASLGVSILLLLLEGREQRGATEAVRRTIEIKLASMPPSIQSSVASIPSLPSPAYGQLAHVLLGHMLGHHSPSEPLSATSIASSVTFQRVIVINDCDLKLVTGVSPSGGLKRFPTSLPAPRSRNRRPAVSAATEGGGGD